MTFGPVQFLLYSADAFMTTLFNTVAQRCHTQNTEQSSTDCDFKQEKKKAKRLQQTFSLFKYIKSEIWKIKYQEKYKYYYT